MLHIVKLFEEWKVLTRRRTLVTSTLLLTFVAGPSLALAGKTDDLVEDSIRAYQRLIGDSEGEIPEKVLQDVRCVLVIPEFRQGRPLFSANPPTLIGYSKPGGKGVVSCRGKNGPWSPLSFLTISGGINLRRRKEKSIPMVLFVLGEKGAEGLIRRKFKLGRDASVSPGPLRSGEADIVPEADLYAYSRLDGLLAGISLQGAEMRKAGKAIKKYYGEKLDPQTILFEQQVPNLPSQSRGLLKILP